MADYINVIVLVVVLLLLGGWFLLQPAVRGKQSLLRWVGGSLIAMALLLGIISPLLLAAEAFHQVGH